MIIQRLRVRPDLAFMTEKRFHSRTRALFVLLAALVLVNATALQALAVQAPRPSSSLFMQTSGPNAGLDIGDYYTSPAGGDTTHLFLIRVPSDWPAGTPVTVALYDPEVGGANPSSPTAADEVRGAADSADFRLVSPGGAAIATATYSDLSTNGAWVELATFDPGVTGTGSYHLRVRVSDDDDNSWRVDVSHDPDCTGALPCDPGSVVDGDEVSRAPSGSGALAVGVIRTSWQHEGPGSSCQDHVFYVNGSTPRPLRAHNFDMDGSGSVTYTTPNGGVVSGTVSGNASWNSSSGTSRVGDVLPDINGWWTAAICVSSHNQYVFEAPSAGPSFPEPQPAPRLAVTKSNGSDGVSVGEEVTYTVVVDNVSDSDSLPGDAHDVIAVDALPVGLDFVSCSSTTLVCSESGGVVTAVLDGRLDPGDEVSFQVVATVTGAAGLALTNEVRVDYTDNLGNEFDTVTAADSDSVDFNPVLDVEVSGPVEVLRGDAATLVYTVFHSALSDGTPVSAVSAACGACSSLTYLGGDANTNGLLDADESWTFEAQIPTGGIDPAMKTAEATVDGTDTDGEPVSASATGQVLIIDPASVTGTIFEDMNGNGVRDAGEPGIGGADVGITGPTGPRSATTDGTGGFGFEHLVPGAYSAAATLGSGGYVPTTPATWSRTLAPGGAGVAEFGYARTGTITGSVFADDDHDGLRQPGDGPIPGVTLRLVDVLGATVATAVTSSGGSFAFTAMPGEYTVEVVSGTPVGWLLTTPASAATGLLLSAGEVHGLAFGVSNHAPVMVEDIQVLRVGDPAAPLGASDFEGDAVTFRLVSGDLPEGLSLEADGTFSGVAGSAGRHPVVVEVCDQADPVGCARYEHVIEVFATETTVEDVSELPFTGVGATPALVAAALVLVAAGGSMVAAHRTGEDDHS